MNQPSEVALFHQQQNQQLLNTIISMMINIRMRLPNIPLDVRVELLNQLVIAAEMLKEQMDA